MKPLLLGAALALLLAADALILVRAAQNRRGAPVARMELTDREFFVPRRDRDTSVVELRLRWRPPAAPPRWQEIRHHPKSGFAVLELQPDSPEGLSRLVLIESGTNLEPLRGRHRDGLVLPAVIRGPDFVGLQNPSVYVPSEYLPVVRRERFAVSLCVGSRNEPWICGARPAP